MIAGLVSGAASAALIMVIHQALTSTQQSKGTLGLKFAGLCLLVIVCTIASRVILVRFTEESCYNLRVELSERILAAPLRHLESVGIDRLLVALKQDISQVSTVLTTIPSLVTNITVVLYCLVYLSWLSPKLLLILFAFLALGIVINRLLTMKASRHFKLSRDEIDILYKHFRSLTTGIKEMKLHRPRREAFMSQGLKASAGAFRQHNISAMLFHGASVAWSQIVYFLFIGMLLFVLADLGYVDTPLLAGYALTILYMIGFLAAVINVAPMLDRASISLDRIEALDLSLAASATEKEATDQPGKASWQSIELDGVIHCYQHDQDNSNFVLGPIDLTLRPQELVFLVGGNGSGKTTLAKLLCGLYVPESGEIRFDGQLLTDENRDQYRQHFSVVFSDFFLFDSLLGLNCPELDERAYEYLVRLQLHRKVQIKNGVLSTLELSQGQRKRLALLTAYLEDRSIYIFDEWAADQDPYFKGVFYHELLPELRAKGKTVIVISHDDRYYHIADRTIGLDYGKIASQYPGIGVKALV